MANITTSGTTSYPAGIDTSTTVTDDPGGTEVVASHHNGPAEAIKAIETELGTDPAGSAADLKTRLAVAMNNDGTVKSSVITGGTGSTVSYSSGVFTVAYSSDAAQFNQNVGLSSSVSGNALTVNIMTGDGDTPSATNFPLIPFRDATITKGNYNVRSVVVTTSVVLPASGTLGFGNNEAGRIYIYALDNTGTVEAALGRKGNFDEGQLHDTVAISAGSNLDTYLYSTTARTNVPIRLIGYIEITTGSTAGNWSNSPARLQNYGPGVRRTGEVVRIFTTTSSALHSGTTTTPNDNTIPQSNEGVRFFELPVSFTSAINRVRYEGSILYQNGTGIQATLHLHRPQIVDAFYAISSNIAAASTFSYAFQYETLTGVVNSTTITLRIGASAGSTGEINAIAAGTAAYNGVAGSIFMVTEVFA